MGVLVNPRARRLGTDQLRELKHAAGPETSVLETGSVDDVAPALSRLMQTGVNVLAVAGGDGTLNHALHGISTPAWPGAWMLLGGGTLNIVARRIGAPVSPIRAIAAMRERYAGKCFAEVDRERVPLLAVHSAGQRPRHGFVFGSEMVKNALELYDQFGGGYSGLSKFLFEVGRGYTFGSALWRAESWRLTPPANGLSLASSTENRQIPTYSAAIASTVDLAIAEGTLRALVRRSGHHPPKGFCARVIEETRTGSLIGLIPTLLRGGHHAKVVDMEEAHTMQLHGAYTLDGECFGKSTRAGEPTVPIVVQAAGSIGVVRTSFFQSS